MESPQARLGPWWIEFLALAVAIAWSAAPAAAQGSNVPADSADLRAEAALAQAEFERERIRRLPWAWRDASGPCDEVIGRFCYWHDRGGGWDPPPEDLGLAAPRDALLARLADAAEALPGDGWIAGQRVRYLVEAGRHGEAMTVARAARGLSEAIGVDAWPRALEGYVLHAAGDFAAAERAFDAALAAMSAEEAGRWTDVAPLVEPRLAREWRSLDAAARPEFARRLWWLADPLWSVAGNERRAEHFARLVQDRFQENARSAFDVAWGRDLREITLRYGWPVGWERARSRSGSLGNTARPGVVAHDAPGGRIFFPPPEVLATPHDAPPDAWPLTTERPRSAYAPAYADSIVELTHQLAVFRRDEDAVVVAAYDLDGADAALVVATGPDDDPEIERATEDRRALRVEVPWRPAVVSLEARAGRRAARARYGLRLPSKPAAVSDLLLLSPGAALPSDLDEAVSRARRTARVRPREEVGVFFELYPPPGADAARLSVSVRDDRRGLGRRIAALFGGGGERGAALSWSEPLPPWTAVLPRAVVVSLPDLPAGRHTLLLEVELTGGLRATVERAIEVY